MLIEQLLVEEGRQFYLFVVVTVIISIVLHELAHGWMAIRHGDDTPIRTGHMTGNPLVHMGPFSLVALFAVGIAWGQMPIDPTRMRGRHAEALVAAAGPITNMLLSLAALTGLGLWFRLLEVPDEPVNHNLARFLVVFGQYNVLLCCFNLMPVPPLDGSHILANYHRGYAMLTGDPTKQGLWILAFASVFFFASAIMPKILLIVLLYTTAVAGDPQRLNFLTQ